LIDEPPTHLETARLLVCVQIDDSVIRLSDGDPDKRGLFKDPCGNTWAISTQR